MAVCGAELTGWNAHSCRLFKSHLVAISLPALHVRVLSTATSGFLPESTPPDVLSGVFPGVCIRISHWRTRLTSFPQRVIKCQLQLLAL